MNVTRKTGGQGLPGGKRWSGVGAKAVGSYLPKLTKKVFEKYGFSTADLLTDWQSIVGQELAACTSPQRLKWPRQGGSWEDADGTVQQGTQRGATLVLRVDGGLALDVQYQTRQILERINGYFGYRAIAELRFVQAPIDAGIVAQPQAPARKVLPKDVIGQHKPEIPEVADDCLRAALERLGASVFLENATKS